MTRLRAILLWLRVRLRHEPPDNGLDDERYW